MSAEYYHGLFCENIGNCVEITCHDGNVYHGYIDHCDHRNVYLRPLNDDGGNDTGLFFFFGAGLIAVGLVAIAAASFSPFFW
ncbi:hypothetical protein [Pseudalkalibacillus sp. SCS-8]|uniref:hypothetical protein n=1 Tax=Pseudalkalibacillus nanhaiensis TaxID=3115291 RepID=UPI0032D9D8E3